MRIHGMWITSTYVTHICLCELVLFTRSFYKVQHYSVLQCCPHQHCFHAEGPDRQMPASVIFFVIRILFLSFHIHLFDSNLHFKVIHRQRHGFILFMGMGACYAPIPQEIS